VSRRLLLVDDAQDIRAIACLSLERIGDWTVVPVASGQAALDAVKGDLTFDAVLLDVMMPGMDGPTTLTGLREGGFPASVPVVFLTAKAQTAERHRLISLGASGVIAKPFDPVTLPEELEQLLEH
jgi:CheY-like chemotaxis protein